MAFQKQYTARQVAEAVLKTTQELLAKSELVKSEAMDKCGSFKKGDWNKIHRKLEGEGYSKESADKIDGSIKAKMGKSEMDKHGLSTEQMKAKLIKDGLSPNEIMSKLKKYESTNSGKENAKPDEHKSKSAEQPANGPAPKGEIHPKEHVEGKSDDVGHTPSPGNNPKEQAEGNNELAGTTPTQVGQDGKNVPGGDEIKGHLKLAKFIGMKEYKRKLSKGMG